MKKELASKLYTYLVENNPDILISLQQQRNITTWINNKIEANTPLLNRLIKENTPPYIIEEMCMDDLTRDLRPSKYNYIQALLLKEFESCYELFREAGILTYEILNIINACTPVFETFLFSAEMLDDRIMDLALIGTIQQYLEEED